MQKLVRPKHSLELPEGKIVYRKHWQTDSTQARTDVEVAIKRRFYNRCAQQRACVPRQAARPARR